MVNIEPIVSPGMPPIPHPHCQPSLSSSTLKVSRTTKICHKKSFFGKGANLEPSLCMYPMQKELLVSNVFFCREPLHKPSTMSSSANTKDNQLALPATEGPQQNGFLKAIPKKAVTCGLYSPPEEPKCFSPFVTGNICRSRRTVTLPAVSFTYRDDILFLCGSSMSLVRKCTPFKQFDSPNLPN